MKHIRTCKKNQIINVTTQQAAELFAAFKALSLASYRRDTSIHLYLDNHAAIYSLLRGRARSLLLPQSRILRRISHLLHWSGLVAAVRYVPSRHNPADPLSRWWAASSLEIVAKAWGLGLACLSLPQSPTWGLLAGLQRAF